MPAALTQSPLPPQEESEHVCSVSNKKAECRPVDGLRPEVLAELQRRGFDPRGEHATICPGCLSSAMTHHARSELTGDQRELAEVEEEIAQRASEIVDEIEHGAPQSFGHRAADAVARVGGSWTFVLGFIAMLVAWAVINGVVLAGGFDPYPFILLNLMLSCLASIQAPIIMMSQSRMAELDRIRATEDFRINLKAQLEIASLHEKIDHLVREQEALLGELNPRRAGELAQEKVAKHAQHQAGPRSEPRRDERGSSDEPRRDERGRSGEPRRDERGRSGEHAARDDHREPRRDERGRSGEPRRDERGRSGEHELADPLAAARTAQRAETTDGSGRWR